MLLLDANNVNFIVSLLFCYCSLAGYVIAGPSDWKWEFAGHAVFSVSLANNNPNKLQSGHINSYLNLCFGNHAAIVVQYFSW